MMWVNSITNGLLRNNNEISEYSKNFLDQLSDYDLKMNSSY
jgi:hypothetical protein